MFPHQLSGDRYSDTVSDTLVILAEVWRELKCYSKQSQTTCIFTIYIAGLLQCAIIEDWFILFIHNVSVQHMIWGSLITSQERDLSFSVLISPNTPMFLQGKISRRLLSSSLMLQCGIFLPNALKSFLLGQITSLLQAISNSLIQVLFYASTFKLNLLRACQLSTTRYCLLIWQFLLSSPWQITVHSSLPFLSFCVIKTHKLTPPLILSASALVSRTGDFYSRIFYISLPSG